MMRILKKLKNKKFYDVVLFLRISFYKYIFNKIPKPITPFILTRIKFINNIDVKFLTHKNDIVLGGRLRKEINKDNYFLSELDFLVNNIRNNSNVLDVGANLGAVSIPLAKMFPSATFYCFEPDTLNYSLLNINISLNNINNICSYNFALGKDDAMIKMYKSLDNFGDHRSIKFETNDLGEQEFLVSNNYIKKINISSLFTNSDIYPSLPKFDIVKIDTQGADFEILETCLPYLKPDAKVAVEFSPYHLYANNTEKSDIKKIYEQFRKVEIIRVNGSKYKLEHISIEELIIYYEQNFDNYNGYMDLVLSL